MLSFLRGDNPKPPGKLDRLNERQKKLYYRAVAVNSLTAAFTEIEDCELLVEYGLFKRGAVTSRGRRYLLAEANE